MKGCNMQNVIPAPMQKNVQTYYQSQGFKAKNFGDLSNELTSQRINLRQRVRDQRESRQMWFTAENQKKTNDNFNSRSQFFQWANIGGNILSNFDDNNVNEVTGLRTLLEPLGVNMKSWSMSLDPNPMTFGDTFAEILNMGAFDDVKKEFGETPNCSALEKKANKKLKKDKQVNEASERIATQCAENPSLDLTLDGQLDQLAKIPQTDLKKQAQEIFNKCTQCHGPEEKGGFSKELGLPVLDLFNLDDFEKDLADNREQTLTLIESMKDRIARPLGSVGSMPPTPPMKPLTDEERNIVIQYLNSLKNGQGNTNNQTGQVIQPGMGMNPLNNSTGGFGTVNGGGGTASTSGTGTVGGIGGGFDNGIGGGNSKPELDGGQNSLSSNPGDQK
jgi:mono/diheme cytochrome c family protein